MTKTNGVDDDAMEFNLRLYVAGQTPKSLAAIANLKKICEENLAGRYKLEVIDLVVTPDAVIEWAMAQYLEGVRLPKADVRWSYADYAALASHLRNRCVDQRERCVRAINPKHAGVKPPILS